MVKKLLVISLVLVFSLLFTEEIAAQCAMCKAVPESAQEAGSDISGRGINKGILYIMAVPYILLMSFVFYFFRDKLKSFFTELGVFKA